MAYVSLEQIKVYQLSCEYGDKCWEIYRNFDWQIKKIFGDQWITSVDSVGANIAEGYGRYHYLDKIKFYYNSRGSLFESKHWLDLIFKRNFINQEEYLFIVKKYKLIQFCLNQLISSVYKAKNNF
jgi:four helix bundle protein